ncbi:hypothetical protein [Parasitella parasitica]|uniref:Pinin/SDK/MemA protein domain-containing protein n=1 Tax=Parasitella parasitica TaxID=35722 RepID=A0A0B7N8H1_9FUNG|nr:hypothetical protein [Parasitella parasitica]
MVQSSIVVPATGQKRTNDEVLNDTHSTDEVKTQPKYVTCLTEGLLLVSCQIKRPRIQESEAGQKRNKRLFGALLGTLNKFKDETEKNSEIDKNRQAINEKLHEKLERERAQLQEKMRERKELKIKLAEEKLEKERQLWQEKAERSKLQQDEILANFLNTKTRPALYYLPKKLTPAMEERINQQKDEASEAKRRFDGQSSSDDRLSDHDEDERKLETNADDEDRLSDHEEQDKSASDKHNLDQQTGIKTVDIKNEASKE